MISLQVLTKKKTLEGYINGIPPPPSPPPPPHHLGPKGNSKFKSYLEKYLVKNKK